MGLKSPSNCWDLIRGRDRAMIDPTFAREKKEDVFIEDTLAEPSPGGLSRYRWNVCFLMPHDVI
jgi:hypothetical protein